MKRNNEGTTKVGLSEASDKAFEVSDKSIFGLASPIRWFGGKGILAKWILTKLPEDHLHYVELFAGGGAVCLKKERRSSIETLNDLDHDLIMAFRILQEDSERTKELIRLLENTPYSREQYKEFVKSWFEEKDVTRRCWKWLMINRQCFGAQMFRGWGYSVTSSHGGRAGTANAFQNLIERLPLYVRRLKDVQLECDSWEKVLDRYDRPETLFYCDPPYVPATRRSGGYRHEMDLNDHERLIKSLLKIEGMAVLSGYPNDLYDKYLLPAGWKTASRDTVCHTAGATRHSGMQGAGGKTRQQKRVEKVWINPRAWTLLQAQR